MADLEESADAPRIQRQRIRRWGGVAAVLMALGYVVIIPMFAHTGPPPAGGEAFFAYLPGKTTAWWWIVGISAVTDLLYIPFSLALYDALKQLNKPLIALGAILMGLFVALDLAVTQGHYASILTLFHSYWLASDGAHRAAYLAAAEYAAALLASPMEIVYAIAIPSIGTLLAGAAMFRSPFGKLSAWFGVATGAFGILALTGWFPFILANALLDTAWLFLVGVKLVRLPME